MVDFKGLADSVAIPLIVVNQSREIVFANSKAGAEFTRVQVGADIADQFKKSAGLKKSIKRAFQSGAKRSAKSTVRAGVHAQYSVTASRLKSVKKGESDLVALTFEDLTPLRAAKSMRSDFVANVSHEIRSPLTALSGFVESLQDSEGIDDETRNLFLGLMAKETERMKNLVSDLLSLSNVEVKESRALTNSVNMVQVLEQASEAVSVLVDKRQKHLVLSIESELPPILGKIDDLVRVFINLLENALNYSSDNGSVYLTANAVRKDNPLKKPAICITVRDEGEGIPDQEIPRLTERFYRVDKSRSRDVGGTGLGLAIVKHVLVRHKGQLKIDSELGVGSTFIVYLPIVS